MKAGWKYGGFWLFGMILGVLIGWCAFGHGNNVGLQEKNTADSIPRVLEHQLMISEIHWEEYPIWREVAFMVDGEVSVCVSQGEDAKLLDMTEWGSMIEIERRKYELSDTVSTQIYEKVTYRIENAQIKASGLEKYKDSEIADAVSGYRLRLGIADEEFVLGYILPMSEFFEPWSVEQMEAPVRRLDAFLEAYRLSGTYENTYPLASKEIAEQIVLKKSSGAVLDCSLQNEGQQVWEYSGDLPALEMWYDGVWLEHPTPYDSNLCMLSCEGGAEKEIKVSAETMAHYSDCMPGLYRLVLYGCDGSYAVSESFWVE